MTNFAEPTDHWPTPGGPPPPNFAAAPPPYHVPPGPPKKQEPILGHPALARDVDPFDPMRPMLTFTFAPCMPEPDEPYEDNVRLCEEGCGRKLVMAIYPMKGDKAEVFLGKLSGLREGIRTRFKDGVPWPEIRELLQLALGRPKLSLDWLKAHCDTPTLITLAKVIWVVNRFDEVFRPLAEILSDAIAALRVELRTMTLTWMAQREVERQQVRSTASPSASHGPLSGSAPSNDSAAATPSPE